MTPAKCSQYSPLSYTLDKHYAETAKKRMLCQNLLTFLMSSVSQTHSTHTHACQLIWSNFR